MGLKKWLKNFLHQLLDKEGFYIILFLCVCIVATMAAWVTKKNIHQFIADDIKTPSVEENRTLDSMDGELYNRDGTIVVEDMEVDEELATSISASSKDEPKKEENIVESKPKKKKKEAKKDKKIEMIKPVKGKKGMDYAADQLIYSKTLDEYTTHYGIDIIASENTPVAAALEGKVIESAMDSKLGITITLSHEDEMITRYANLNGERIVKVGDCVKKGQIIGHVGKTSLFETLEEPHLHFEVLIDGKNVDPNQFLSIKN
ncbi:MAG: M23 family metallopeptidase [Marinisporobacter sp.]|jgi:murein DD-endopeptidase MepM/ murein hydrolase activator NlpD|nr:M23 family metallopeptidase [Marinisporobacter sp.]